MSSNRVIRVRGADADLLREGIARIQAEQELPTEFPPEVLEAAEEAARRPRLPELDRTDIPLVTIDPDGAMDLDQALYLERGDGGGFVVHYAIADVAAFVSPGDPVDLEANRRGETFYAADSRIPLHPPVISEGAGSLLPDQVRPSLLWSITCDETGEGTEVNVERALVRSRARLSYEQAQQQIDDGTGGESLALLKELGELRLHRDASRGGVALPLPEQVVDTGGEQWRLEFRSMLPVELWNAEMSLLTGFGAATLMVYARVGLLRTLPPPDPRDVKRLHRTATALGIDWPAEQMYPDFIRTLDPTMPNHAAMVDACTRLLRGSGYLAFDGEIPDQAEHAALASEYAHVTAPLRRLGDRYAGEVCLALCSDRPVPGWVLEALPGLPATMQRSGQRASGYERAVLDLVEAAVLARRVGEEFSAVVVSVDESDPTRGDVMLRELGVEAPVQGAAELPVGTEVTVRLEVADVAAREVLFRLA